MVTPNETITDEQETTSERSQAPASGARLVTADGRTLPLEATSVEAQAAGGLARVVLKQRFRNPGVDPLAVRYGIALPADAAVSAYVFEIDGRGVSRPWWPRAIWVRLGRFPMPSKSWSM